LSPAWKCIGSLINGARSRASLVCLEKARSNDRRDAHADPAKPGRPARHDYEYERNGVANLFMSSRRWKAGAMSRSPTATPPSIMPTCCGNYPTWHFPDAAKSCWCRIISTPTSPPRSMKPSGRRSAAGSSSASNGITRPSTAAGSTWPNRTRRARVQCLIAASTTRNPRHQVSAWQDHRNKHLRQSKLAIHNRRCPRQAEKTVPSVRVTRATSRSRGWQARVMSAEFPAEVLLRF